MSRRTTAELIVCLISSMHTGPCLRKQLLCDLGLDPKRTDLIKPHMIVLIRSGWVRIAAWQGPHPMYGWQSAPFALPDAEKPVKVPKRSAAPKHRRPAVAMLPAASSVFGWGSV